MAEMEEAIQQETELEASWKPLQMIQLPVLREYLQHELCDQVLKRGHTCLFLSFSLSLLFIRVCLTKADSRMLAYLPLSIYMSLSFYLFPSLYLTLSPVISICLLCLLLLLLSLPCCCTLPCCLLAAGASPSEYINQHKEIQ